MPTQMEIEYWRRRYQRMNQERFYAANTIALVTHTLTQPLDLVRIRSQMLQEGKTFTGLSLQRGWYPFHILEETYNAGGGLRKFYSSIDAFVARTLAYTTARITFFGYFYDKINKDPRRVAVPDKFVTAGIAGGFLAGFVTNPIDIVYDRMQVDEMYPERARRNYRNLLDGLTKVSQEGALFRGAFANGCRIAALTSSMTSLYDWCKENSYYFLGPHWFNRLFGTAVAVTVGTVVALPFEAIRVRLHTMRPLPTGQMPYNSTFDVISKMFKYECNMHHSSNFQSFLAGFEAYWLRLFLIAFVSQFMLDYYHAKHYDQEFWQPARFHYQTGIDYDIHDPFTDTYMKMLNANYVGKGGLAAAHPSGKQNLILV